MLEMEGGLIPADRFVVEHRLCLFAPGGMCGRCGVHCVGVRAVWCEWWICERGTGAKFGSAEALIGCQGETVLPAVQSARVRVSRACACRRPGRCGGLLARGSGLRCELRRDAARCGQVTPQQLMRVYGALMWSLGKVCLLGFECWTCCPFGCELLARVEEWRDSGSDTGAVTALYRASASTGAEHRLRLIVTACHRATDCY